MELVTMPQLGETVTEGTITRWTKQVGEPVEVDEVLFEVSTDKVDTDVPSAHTGYVRRILVGEGETVAIGTPLAVITASIDEPLAESDGAAPPEAAAPPPRRAVDRVPTHPRVQPTGRRERHVSPVVRRLLDEHRLDARDVVGSGRDGRVTRADVLAAAANRQRLPAAPVAALAAGLVPTAIAGPDDDVVELSRARRVTAANMVSSLATSAHTLVATDVDYDRVDGVRRHAGLSYLPFVARAALIALTEHPHLNASMGDDCLIVHRSIHLGVAVDVDHEALVVPVVRDAPSLRLPALAESIADLAARARQKRLGPDDLAGGTFTITNVGAYGTTVTSPIINQPQVAILSTDGVRMRPVAARSPAGEWVVAVRPVGGLSLTFDHRAVDGAYSASFLARVRELLETRDWHQEL